MDILWELAGARDYYIEVSTDGYNYTKVAEAEGLASYKIVMIRLYVKARVYVTQNRKKYYGLWSKVKTLKLK